MDLEEQEETSKKNQCEPEQNHPLLFARGFYYNENAQGGIY